MKAKPSVKSVQPGTHSAHPDSVKLWKSGGRVQTVYLGWQGVEAWPGVPAAASSRFCSVWIMWCPEMGVRGNTQRPAHSVSQTVWTSGPFPSGTLHAMENVFRNYINLSLSRPNVTVVTGRLLHAFLCSRSRCTACWVSFLTGKSKHRKRAAAPSLWKICRQPWPF